MKLDKIYSTWEALDQVYEKKGKPKGESKKQFLSALVDEDAVSRLRSIIMSDFVETAESRAKFEQLFSAISKVQKTIKGIDEIESLYDFVWKEDETVSSNLVIDLSEFEVLSSKEFGAEEKFVAKGIFDSVYWLENGEVKSKYLNPNSDSLVCFNTQNEMLAWLSRQTSSVSEESAFWDKVYALIVHILVSQRLSFPMVFTSQKCELIEPEYFEFDQKFKTIVGGQFHCKCKGVIGTGDGMFEKVSVVQFE